MWTGPAAPAALVAPEELAALAAPDEQVALTALSAHVAPAMQTVLVGSGIPIDPLACPSCLSHMATVSTYSSFASVAFAIVGAVFEVDTAFLGAEPIAEL